MLFIIRQLAVLHKVGKHFSVIVDIMSIDNEVSALPLRIDIAAVIQKRRSIEGIVSVIIFPQIELTGFTFFIGFHRLYDRIAVTDVGFFFFRYICDADIADKIVIFFIEFIKAGQIFPILRHVRFPEKVLQTGSKTALYHRCYDHLGKQIAHTAKENQNAEDEKAFPHYFAGGIAFHRNKARIPFLFRRQNAGIKFGFTGNSAAQRNSMIKNFRIGCRDGTCQRNEPFSCQSFQFFRRIGNDFFRPDVIAHTDGKKCAFLRFPRRRRYGKSDIGAEMSGTFAGHDRRRPFAVFSMPFQKFFRNIIVLNALIRSEILIHIFIGESALRHRRTGKSLHRHGGFESFFPQLFGKGLTDIFRINGVNGAPEVVNDMMQSYIAPLFRFGGIASTGENLDRHFAFIGKSERLNTDGVCRFRRFFRIGKRQP